MTEEANKSGLQKLWDLKFPQYIGTYFAVGFGALQFLEFLSKRYDLSGNFVDKYLLVWFALLPALLILIYFQGKLNPTTEKGVLKWPKIAVIGNLIIAFLLGGLFFNGDTSVASQGELVQVTNEEGKELNAVVPALHKVKSVACFQFENLTGDDSQEWWSAGFSYLLQLDLNQRPEFYALSQYELHPYYDRLGLEPLKLPNVGMQREIAKKSRSDFFTNISYAKEGKLYVFKGNLFSTKNGQAISELTASNEDPYAAVDAIKQQIFDQIPDPFENEKNEVHLPASALVTANQEALKNIILSTNTFLLNPSALEEVKNLAEKSVELDPTCSLCSVGLGGVLFTMGKQEEAAIHIRNAVKYGASLPERMQFDAKDMLYGITNKAEASIKLQEMRRKMFPYEFTPYERLLPIYRVNYGIDSAKVLMREAIANGNLEKGLLELYDLQVQDEEYQEAEKTLKEFSDAFPEREQDKMKYADIFSKQGKIEETKKILLEEETMDPFKTSIQTQLAFLDFRESKINDANKRLEKGLKHATTLSDSLSYLWTKGYFLRMTGQIAKSIEVFNNYEKLGLKQMPETAMIVRTFFMKTDLFQSIGQLNGVEEIVHRLEKYSPESAATYRCIAITNLIERDYGELSEDEYLACRDIYQTMGDGFGAYYDLLIAYKANNYQECLKILNRNGEKLRTLFDNKRYFLVNIYVKAGKLDMAKKLAQKTIDQKTQEPLYYYQMASLLEKENKKQALEHLTIAMKYWNNADADYIPLLKAKELAKRLSIYNADQS